MAGLRRSIRSREWRAGFASRLAEVICIRTLRISGEPDDEDARSVNAHMVMIAKEADSLIAALLQDAEARGLETSGRWMKIPLVECREVEVVALVADDADDIRDQKLNS